MLQYSLSSGGRLPQSMQVKLHLPKESSSCREFYLPYYRPGRYHPADYVKHIFDLKAYDAYGTIIPVVKSGLNTWKVECSVCVLSYSYRCRTFDAGGSWLSEEMCYFNPVNLLLIPKACEMQPVQLDIQCPEQMRVLYPPLVDRPVFATYFEAIDTPFVAASDAQTFAWQQHDCQFFLHIIGHLPLPEVDLPALFQAFAEPMYALFGGFPFTRYDYLVFCTTETRYHGVEHRDCTVITLPQSEDKEKNLKDLLGVASHELFHAWNVCRIRPRALQPYALSGPVIFETGYALEGFTTYYGDLMLYRGGLLDDEGFVQELNSRVEAHYRYSGRHYATLISSSQNLWANAYDVASLDTEVSIYTKGLLAAWALDLAIKKASGGEKSLDDVLRNMWEEFPASSAGYTHADIKRLVQQAGGDEALDVFELAVESTEAIEHILIPLLAEEPWQLVAHEDGYRVELKKEPKKTH